MNMNTGYWYPTQVRVEALTRELSELERAARGHTDSPQVLVSLFSAALIQAEKTVGFPTRQLARWIWVGSQFRLYGSERVDVATLARGALTFLTVRLARGVINETDVQDLNWVLDSTIHRLSNLLGPQSLRSCLSGDDLTRIEKRLASYKSNSAFDPELLRSRIQSQLTNLDALAKDPNFRSIASKIEGLFEACGRPGRESEVARTALLYLADIPDVIRDSLGVIGLLDDIYVIETAYAAIESQTRCLPLLEALLGKWPFVADLPLVGSGPSPLDRYSQYIACACLFSLFETDGNSMLVVRESAAHCIISSLMAAVEALRKESNAADLDIAKWAKGQAITISDGTTTFKALYGGTMDVGSTRKLRIGVSGNGWITVDARMLPYIARAQAAHTTLSKGNQISQWLKDRYIDPLVYLTGSSRQRLKQQECILLVGPRHKLDAYLSCINPLGSSMAALVGVKYVTAHHRFENLGETATDTPCVYACNDVNTALDLIREPPEHVETWRIIVDGARTGRALLGSIAHADEFAATSLCIFAELHEREATYDIAKLNASVWYLEDQHIEVPPLKENRPNAGDDALVRALTRQTNHWTASRTLHVARNAFLEQVFECMKERVTSNRGSDSETTALDLSLSAFLQRATSRPISNAEVDNNLTNLARSIASQASVLRQYDAQADRLYNLFKSFITAELPSFNKENELSLVADVVRSGESVAVICRSEQIAESCKALIRPESRFANFKWMNLERLRQLAPVDRVIVAGWLDKMAMRELNDNGYGTCLDLLLYPFEEKWFTRTVDATRKWERRLEAKTEQRFAALAELFKDRRNAIFLKWSPTTPSSAIDDEDFGNVGSEESEVDKLEARAIETLNRKVAAEKGNQGTAKAQLVLFDQAGEYAFLPPAGKVIVLDRDFLDDELLARGQAEHLLFRSVSALEPGMVLALPTGADRDLIDARADQFLRDAAKVRYLAGLWKTALKRHMLGDNSFFIVGHHKFSQQLAAAGHKRAPSTILGWVTHTNTIAPINFREVIPIIARLTEDAELETKCEAVLQSIDLMYRARTRAAEAIVQELFAGKIDIKADELCFELDGTKIRYLLRHVRRMEGIQEVPTDMIGKVGSLTAPRKSQGVFEWSV